MKTFFNILQTLVDEKNKRYPDDPFTLIFNKINMDHVQFSKISEIDTQQFHIRYLINMMDYMFKKQPKTRCYKYRMAYVKFASLSSIIHNTFVKKAFKEYIFLTFSQAQKHYNAFSRLARIYKFHTYKTVVSDDLTLTPLDINHKNTFVLLDNKSKYLFSINDLISVVENAIGNAPDFFVDPLVPSNPYNKQPFSLATLYNIYFRMKESGRLMSVLFHFFFLESFNIIAFVESYEEYIKEKAIHRFTYNSHSDTLYPYVLYMLKNNTYTKRYEIHSEFPKSLLVSIFKPYLFYYFIAKYTNESNSKNYAYSRTLDKKLYAFYKYNTKFGHMTIQLTYDDANQVKAKKRFNTNHINFYGIIEDTEQSEDFVSLTNNIFHQTNNIQTNNIQANNIQAINYIDTLVWRGIDRLPLEHREIQLSDDELEQDLMSSSSDEVDSVS